MLTTPPPPGPRSSLLTGLAWRFSTHPLHRLADLVARYGDLVVFTFQKEQIYLFNHPEYIREVLVTQAFAFLPQPPPALLRLDRLRRPSIRRFAPGAAGVCQSGLERWYSGCEHLSDTVSRASALLENHPTSLQTVIDEVNRVLGAKTPEAGDAARLLVLRRVFFETLRLYPPRPVIARCAQQDVCIGGYRVPAGSLVLISPWLIQRDDRYYPAPLEFDPDRWKDIPENSWPDCTRDSDLLPGAGRAFTYLPFGVGAHRCPVEPLAWSAAVVMLALKHQAL